MSMPTLYIYNLNKENKMREQTKTLTTHNGSFHADEVTAIALLKIFTNDNFKITRTRDNKTISGSDITVDVGGAYNPENNQFDHHQIDYKGTLSSAGMIFEYLEIDTNKYSSLTNLIKEVDEQDTGVKRHEPLHYCNLISGFNSENIYSEKQNTAFLDAIDFAIRIINNLIRADEKTYENKIAAEAIEIEKERNIKIAKVPKDSSFLPATLFIEKADLVISFDNGQSCWTVATVPMKRGEFGSKLSLEPTRLSSEVFTHKGGFIGKYKETDGSITFKIEGELINYSVR